MELPRRGKNRESDLRHFANELKRIDENTGFKVSSRGWCYQLEGLNVITKGDFNRVQSLINECRKNGLLPINFVAEENARQFEGIWDPDNTSPEEDLTSWINATLKAGDSYKPDYWENETCFIQMLVEKIDLVTLFKPVCELYNIGIATGRGWSSISQRAEIAQRFKEMEETGHTPVLLYCGDMDAFGLGISDFLMKNFRDIELGTGWSPRNLIIDRFGLNYDFIMENNLTWIENLETGSGKQADISNPIVKKYVDQYGYRKVEANAIVVNPRAGQMMCVEAIEKHIPNARTRFGDIKERTVAMFNDVMNDCGIRGPLNEALEMLKVEEDD